MELKCECGVILNASITEGNNPGCKEREEINCPNCNETLYSQILNDARIFVNIAYDPRDRSGFIDPKD